MIFSEILWYILDDLKNVIENLKKNYNGILIINQTFYGSGQKYGNNFFTNQEEMITYFDLVPLVRTEYRKNADDSYETHTVFDIRND